jgi:hypothetical protein
LLSCWRHRASRSTSLAFVCSRSVRTLRSRLIGPSAPCEARSGDVKGRRGGSCFTRGRSRPLIPIERYASRDHEQCNCARYSATSPALADVARRPALPAAVNRALTISLDSCGSHRIRARGLDHRADFPIRRSPCLGAAGVRLTRRHRIESRQEVQRGACSSNPRTPAKPAKSLSVVRMANLRRMLTAQIKKSVLDPWSPFARQRLKHVAASS